VKYDPASCVHPRPISADHDRFSVCDGEPPVKMAVVPEMMGLSCRMGLTLNRPDRGVIPGAVGCPAGPREVHGPDGLCDLMRACATKPHHWCVRPARPVRAVRPVSSSGKATPACPNPLGLSRRGRHPWPHSPRRRHQPARTIARRSRVRWLLTSAASSSCTAGCDATAALTWSGWKAPAATASA
jgi:hypothetical protein